MSNSTTGTIFSLERFSLHNGPGIRSTLFLKGCPFACLWCGNPESWLPQPQLAYNRDLCLPACGECIQTCPEGAVREGSDGRVDIEWPMLEGASSDTIRRCAEVCPTGALWVSGEVVDAETAADRLLADTPFYKESGGGVTISGGEPLQQPQFTREVLERVKERGVHTALDTSGGGTTEDLHRVSAVSDLVLFDIKAADPELHRQWTGRDNEAVLRNLKALLSTRRESVIIRFPFVPPLNGTPERINEMVDLLGNLGVDEIELLPYHRLGIGKYPQLGREYPLPDVASPDQARLDRVTEQFENAGIHVSIV